MNWPLLKETEQEKRRRLYRPHEVSRMERVLLWQGKYLKPGSVQSAALRLWVFCKTRRGLSYAEVVAALPFTRATAYRRRDRALSEIALGLTADGIARGDH